MHSLFIRKLFFFAVALLSPLITSSCRSLNQSDTKAIFGSDDRQELFESDDPQAIRIAGSTVMLVRRSKLKDTGDGYYTLTGKRVAELEFDYQGVEYNLCPDQLRFAEQFSVGYCSGALVAEDPQHGAVIGTAGHCIHNIYDCQETAVIFNYQMKSPNQDMLRVPANDVFHCSEVLASVDDFGHRDRFVDFAFFTLDGLTGRAPLAISDEAVRKHQDVMVIGHSWGLPGKISRGKVRQIFPGRFGSDFDGLNGNSGSAIVNTSTNKIAGFWSNGPIDDFVFDSSRKCLLLASKAVASASSFNEANTVKTFEVPGFIERQGPSIRVMGARLKRGWATVRKTHRSEGFDGPAIQKGDYELTIDLQAAGTSDITKVDLALSNNILVLPKNPAAVNFAFDNIARGSTMSIKIDVELRLPCINLDMPAPRLPLIEFRAKFSDGYEKLFGVRLPCIADAELAKLQPQPAPAAVRSLESGSSSILYANRPICSVAADCLCGAVSRKSSFLGRLDATYPVEWLSNNGRFMICQGLKRSIHDPKQYLFYIKNSKTGRLTRGL